MILVPAAIARADNTQTRGHSVVLGLDERDVVPLEHDPAQGLLGVPLQVHLGGVVPIKWTNLNLTQSTFKGILIGMYAKSEIATLLYFIF